MHRIVNFYIHREHDVDLKRLAKKSGISVSDLIRIAIDDLLWSKIALDKPYRLKARLETLVKKHRLIDAPIETAALLPRGIEIDLNKILDGSYGGQSKLFPPSEDTNKSGIGTNSDAPKDVISGKKKD